VHLSVKKTGKDHEADDQVWCRTQQHPTVNNKNQIIKVSLQGNNMKRVGMEAVVDLFNSGKGNFTNTLPSGGSLRFS
jgi:hypothetical protein